MLSIAPNPSAFISHLVPLGSPTALSPFIVLVESVRHRIRPITLSVRLIANLVAGHLLLALTVIPFSLLRPISTFVLLFQIILVCLELAVALVQSYVFFNLVSLYSVPYRVFTAVPSRVPPVILKFMGNFGSIPTSLNLLGPSLTSIRIQT